MTQKLPNNILAVTDDTFEEEVIESNQLVLIDFWASSCAPCRRVMPILKELVVEYPDLKIVKVDVSTELTIASDYNITVIPTLIFYKNSEPLARLVGSQPKCELKSIIDEWI